MNYQKFCELISKGECKNIDFKIVCNAFNKNNKKDTAELIKDIIALSNNGNIANFLIIGVSDDRKQFCSVENKLLTDDNIQTLCKDNIFPIPKVKLHNCLWQSSCDEIHKNKHFVIIQVGPQARQCFRFNRDNIRYSERFSFRKNEVWIRRESTSDLATPEEIAKLLKGKDPITKIDPETNKQYDRLTLSEASKAIIDDLKIFIENNDGIFRIYENKKFSYHYYSILLRVKKMNLRLGVFITDKCDKKNNLARFNSKLQYLDHGTLVISLGNITALACQPFSICIKEKWGKFCTEYKGIYYMYRDHFLNKIPTNNHEEVLEPFCFGLDKVTNTRILNNKLIELMKTIESKDDIYNHVYNSYRIANSIILDWRAQDCPVNTGKKLIDFDLKIINPDKDVDALEKGEFIDKTKYGNQIMINDKKYSKFIDTLYNE